MRIFLFAIGARDRASSRLRVWDHLAWLEGEGFKVAADSFAGPGRIPKVALLRRVLRRLPIWIRQFWRADVVLIQESLILWPLVLLAKVGKRRRVIFDFSDPVDRIGVGWRRRLRSRLLALIVKRADIVIVENRSYLSRFSSQSTKMRHFFGPVNASRYAASRKVKQAEGKVRIGWTGSPSTLPFIEPLLPLLDEIARRRPIQLVLMGVSAADYTFENAEVIFVPWDEEREFSLVPSFDIGLFRLEPTEDSLWRGAGKLFIYCAAGVPFVASDRGIASDLMHTSQLGFPVQREDDWAAVLDDAIGNSDRRDRQAEQLVDYARQNLSYERYRRSLRGWIDGSAEPVK